MRTTARREGDEFVLDGGKRFITNAAVANLYTVFAKTDPEAGHSGISAFLVESDAPGFEVARLEPKMGISGSTTGELVFDGCRVPAANLLGAEGEGFRIAMRILDRSRPGVAAQGLGIAPGRDGLRAGVREDARDDGQADRPAPADRREARRHGDEVRGRAGLLYRFGRMVDEGAPDEELTKASAMAKLYCTDVAMEVTTEAVQVLGGYGYIKEYPVERMMRDAKITQLYEGTNEIQRLVIAREMLAEQRAFLLAARQRMRVVGARPGGGRLVLRVEEAARLQREAAAADARGQPAADRLERADPLVELGAPRSVRGAPSHAWSAPCRQGASASAPWIRSSGMPADFPAWIRATRRSVTGVYRRWLPSVRRDSIRPSRS